MKLISKLTAILALFTAAAFAQQTYPFTLSPNGGVSATLNKYTSPSIVQIPTPVVVSLASGVVGNHVVSVNMPPTVDVNGNINTAMFSFTITNADGSYNGSQGLVLGSGGPTSVYLNVNVALLPATSGQPLGIPMYVTDASSGLTSAIFFYITNVDGRTYVYPASNVRALPHVASGVGWQTIVEFTNQNSSNTQVRVDFSDQSGNPLALHLADGRQASSIYEDINAHGNASITIADSAATSTIIATALVTPTIGFPVGVTEIFNTTNVPHSAGVAAQLINTDSLTFFYDTTNGNAIGLALLNSLNYAEPLTLTYYDQFGNQLAQTTETLCAGCQIARTLTAAVVPAIQGKTGTITASFPAGFSAMTGIAFRFDSNFFFIPILPITNTIQ
jgi:hypothetical protein